jgi:cleavage and polyadenylation specificity factor subunit 4
MHPSFPPPVPNLAAAANPMAAAAAANPFLALQLLGQAQQLQNLGFLAAAALQQQQQQPQAPFFPGGFTPNPNQFAPYAGGPPPAGFNGVGAFRPGSAGICGPRPPRPMLSPAGKSSNNNNNVGSGGAPKPIPTLNVEKDYSNNNNARSGGMLGPILNDVRKDRNNSGDCNGEVIESFAVICWD